MRREDLELLLRRDPCPRLRLHMTGGEVFEIEDPDSIVFGRSTVEILLPPGEREAILNILHIVWIELLQASA